METRDPVVTVGWHVRAIRVSVAAVVLGLVVAGIARLSGQGAATGLTVVSRDSRRGVPITVVGGQEMVGLDDLAATFQVSVREENGALTVSYKGRTIVLTPDQTIVSVAGRVISLPTSPIRVGRSWLVPVDFISRALAGIYDARLELRRASHLIIVGDLRVPHLTLRQEPLGAGARLTIDIMPRAIATVTQEGRERLKVTLDADALDVAFPPSQLPGFIQGYRAVNTTSFAVELGARFGSFRSSTQATDAASSLVIDLLPQQSEVTPPPITTQTPLPAPAPPAAPPDAGILAALGGARLRTIVVDAGHGGDDLGARAANGTTEKLVTLAVARRLKASIEARLGIRVVMTRDYDQQVALADRTALANNSKADLFISLHANRSFRDTVSGAAIYVASFERGVATRELLAPERLPVFGGGSRDIELVPWNLAQTRHQARSEAFAAIVAEQLHDRARPVDHAPLVVLEAANMPAVMIEMGYLSNSDQASLLGSIDFQTVLVQGVVDAIGKFKDATGSAEGAAH